VQDAVKQLTVIVPIHNESAILAANTARLRKAMDAAGWGYEIIIAEDGSTDGSGKIARTLASSDGRVRAVTSDRRVGRGVSLANAIRTARGEIVMYVDADLPADRSHINELVREIERGADICAGSRLLPGSRVIGRSAVREFFSRGYNLILRILFHTSVFDHQCGFKAFRKSSVLPLLDKVQDKHWFWDSELLIRAQRKGLKVIEIPVRWTDRKQSGVRLSTDVVSMGIAALALRLRLR